MTLSETYDKMGGDYKDVIGRFYSADLIQRFLKKFPDDPSYHNLCEAFAQNDVKAAFCAAHTLKGICQNLAIANLAQPLCTMTELLRAEQLEEARTLHGGTAGGVRFLLEFVYKAGESRAARLVNENGFFNKTVKLRGIHAM